MAESKPKLKSRLKAENELKPQKLSKQINTKSMPKLFKKSKISNKSKLKLISDEIKIKKQSNIEHKIKASKIKPSKISHGVNLKNNKILKEKHEKIKEEESKHLKVLNNLKKLAKKQKKILTNIPSARPKIKAKYNEKSDLGKTMLKSSILSKDVDPYNAATSRKLNKTQRKPKIKRIDRNKISSPSKLLSSDSELNELSPERYRGKSNALW